MPNKLGRKQKIVKIKKHLSKIKYIKKTSKKISKKIKVSNNF